MNQTGFGSVTIMATGRAYGFITVDFTPGDD
jgi:hypothetical protein